MADSNKKDKLYGDTTMKINKVFLKIAGVLKAIAAAGYALILIVLAATGSMSNIIEELGNSVKIGDIPTEVIFYVTFAVTIVFNAIYAFLCFRATKQGAKPIALIILSLVAFFYTELTRDGGGILSGNFSWAYVITTIINLGVFGCAFQTYRYNKMLEKK